MALAAEGQFEVRLRERVGIAQMVGQFAVANGTGEGGMFASDLEGFDLFMAWVAFSFDTNRRRRFQL